MNMKIFHDSISDTKQLMFFRHSNDVVGRLNKKKLS